MNGHHHSELKANGVSANGLAVAAEKVVIERPSAPTATVDGFWQAPEPRDPRAPHNYLGRIIAWFRPPMAFDEEGRERYERALDVLRESDAKAAAKLDVEFHSHAKLAAQEYQALEARIEERIGERNSWILCENVRAEVEAEPLKQVVDEREAQLDQAHRSAAAACSAAGCAYDPARPNLEAVTARPVDLEVQRLPVRRRVSDWAARLAPWPLGAVLGLTLFHAAGFLKGSAFDDLRMGWPTFLVAWLLGAAFYFVLGAGVRAVARRGLVWSRQVGLTDTARLRLLTWGGWVLAISAALPFAACAVVEGFGAHHLALERQGGLLGGAAGVLGWWVFAAIGFLMSSAFFAADFWSEVNAEDDQACERANRIDVATAEAQRLRDPRIQAALEAVSLVLVQRESLTRAQQELAKMEARISKPIWQPTAEEQGRLDDARAMASGAAHTFHAEFLEAFGEEPESEEPTVVRSLGAPVPRRGSAGWWILGSLLTVGVAALLFWPW